jgi:hypothetical protein
LFFVNLGRIVQQAASLLESFGNGT